MGITIPDINWWIGGPAVAIAFTLLVGIHELGHLIAFKRFGLPILEFGIGIPLPAMNFHLTWFGLDKKYRITWKLPLFTWGETRFVLCILPLGGYVMPIRELSHPLNPDNAPTDVRIISALAGPATNFVLAIMLYSVIFSNVGVPTDGITVSQVFPNTPATAAGIQTGDAVLEINTIKVGRDVSVIVKETANNPGRNIPVTLERNGQLLTAVITPGPWTDPGTGATYSNGLGISYSQRRVPGNRLQVVGGAFRQTTEATKSTFLGLGRGIVGLVQNVFGAREAPSGVMGPIGIGRVIGGFATQAATTGNWLPFLELIAALNLSLFVLNLLPILPLDGGHIVQALIDRLFPRWASFYKRATGIVGGLLLLALLGLASISDIIR